MSAKARRQKREHERLVVQAKRKIRELDHVILAAQRIATAEWWGGGFDETARKHFSADGMTHGVKLETLVSMAGGDYVRFVVHYLLVNERALANELLEVLGNDAELVRTYEDVVGGSNEQLAENIQQIEEHLTSIGYDVVIERDRLLTKLASGRRTA